jgi:hypothetical protein
MFGEVKEKNVTCQNFLRRRLWLIINFIDTNVIRLFITYPLFLFDTGVWATTSCSTSRTWFSPRWATSNDCKSSQSFFFKSLRVFYLYDYTAHVQICIKPLLLKKYLFFLSRRIIFVVVYTVPHFWHQTGSTPISIFHTPTLKNIVIKSFQNISVNPVKQQNCQRMKWRSNTSVPPMHLGAS